MKCEFYLLKGEIKEIQFKQLVKEMVQADLKFFK